MTALDKIVGMGCASMELIRTPAPAMLGGLAQRAEATLMTARGEVALAMACALMV
jgi:hypothetical protein